LPIPIMVSILGRGVFQLRSRGEFDDHISEAVQVVVNVDTKLDFEVANDPLRSSVGKLMGWHKRFTYLSFRSMPKKQKHIVECSPDATGLDILKLSPTWGLFRCLT